MKNHLERFVRDNREAFDDYEPSKDLWKKIEKKTVQKKRIGRFLSMKGLSWNDPKFTLRIAAGIFIVLTIGYLAYNYGKSVTKNVDILVMSPSYAKELTQFTSLVETKREELKELEKEDPQLYHQFDADLNVLDQNYQSLKQKLPKNPNQEELLKAMIQNLNMQIDLLNQQLQIIQKIKDAKNGKTSTIV